MRFRMFNMLHVCFFNWYPSFYFLIGTLPFCTLHIRLALGKHGLMHVRKLSSQIRLKLACAVQRANQGQHIPHVWYFSFKTIVFFLKKM